MERVQRVPRRGITDCLRDVGVRQGIRAVVRMLRRTFQSLLGQLAGDRRDGHKDRQSRELAQGGHAIKESKGAMMQSRTMKSSRLRG
jgi:hypothetical protein